MKTNDQDYADALSHITRLSGELNVLESQLQRLRGDELASTAADSLFREVQMARAGLARIARWLLTARDSGTS